MNDSRLIHDGFLDSVAKFPDRPALNVDGIEVSYSELFTEAQRIAAIIKDKAAPATPPLVAIFAYRSRAAFAGILGALLSGNGYVPLNRTFPVERTRTMLTRAGCSALVVDSGSCEQLGDVLEGIESPLTLIFPEENHSEALEEQWLPHVAVGAKGYESASTGAPSRASPKDIAYLLFTSGSTGVPKGVMVAHSNAVSFIDVMTARYKVNEQDRFSQMFDMTFDLSVFDMFVAWSAGACVCCPSRDLLMRPGQFIVDQGLTVWFSVPSVMVFMKRFRMLEENAYPSLRISLFCGEPLPVESADSWQSAAPGSILENLYGPTELTIACTYYRWDRDSSGADAEMDLVPIGYPYTNMTPLVADEKLEEVAPGEEGELLMAGPQVTLGYLNDPEKTAAAFVIPPGRQEVYYRTGDRVRRPHDGGPLTFLGRVDFQVKIGGYRVELGEIEAVVRKSGDFSSVAAIPWPVSASGADGVEIFVEGSEPEGLSDIQKQISRRLPFYMVPRKWHFLDSFPLNSNGKVDRGALQAILEKAGK